MGRGSSKVGGGLGPDWVDFADWNLKGDEFNDHFTEKKRQFAEKLRKAGAFGDENITTEEADKRLDWVYAERLGYDYDDNVGRYPKTPAVGIARWKNGAWAKGYGDSREAFDNTYGISKFIDGHSELQLNTDKPLYRGVRTSDTELRQLFNAKDKGYQISMRGLSSWSTEKGIADQFTQTTLVGKEHPNTVVFKDITKGKRKAMPYPYSGQDEVLSSKNARYKIKNIRKEGNIYYVEVTQK